MEFASFNVNCKIPIASVSSFFPLHYGRHRPIHIFGKNQLVISTVAFDLKHMNLASQLKSMVLLSQVYLNSQSSKVVQ